MEINCDPGNLPLTLCKISFVPEMTVKHVGYYCWLLSYPILYDNWYFVTQVFGLFFHNFKDKKSNNLYNIALKVT